jgi:hypothetical protein
MEDRVPGTNLTNFCSLSRLLFCLVSLCSIVAVILRKSCSMLAWCSCRRPAPSTRSRLSALSWSSSQSWRWRWHCTQRVNSSSRRCRNTSPSSSISRPSSPRMPSVKRRDCFLIWSLVSSYVHLRRASMHVRLNRVLCMACDWLWRAWRLVLSSSRLSSHPSSTRDSRWSSWLPRTQITHTARLHVTQNTSADSLAWEEHVGLRLTSSLFAWTSNKIWELKTGFN